MTFENQTINMEDYSIQTVTPPLVDPLTEAANAHLAALAQAEAAEMILKQNSEDSEKVKLSIASSSSSSTTSISELHQPLSSEAEKPEPEPEPEKPKMKVPIPLVEEYKEPGVSFYKDL